MRVLTIVATLALILIIGFVLVLWQRTYKTEQSANQAAFESGSADLALVDGDYVGRVTRYDGAWQGKTFYRSEQRGINRLKEQDRVVLKYPFATYVARGLRDKNQDVIVLDYNQPGNPWWLRFIVDEMVATAPNAYLGKIHIRLAPGVVFSVGYFTLTKAS